MKNNIHEQPPRLEFPENIPAIERQKTSGDFAPAEQQNQFPGYPAYPDSEDAFRAAEIVPLVEEGDVPPTDELPEPDAWNEVSEFTGDDLDVPGAELDDEDEEIGREDEENNYYSLGGDKEDVLESNRED